jgi:predicted GH43/DUF377 family glycosyl hydrolase
MKTLIKIVIILICIFSITACATFSIETLFVTKLKWTKESGVRIDIGDYSYIGVGYPEIVTLNDGSYRMYFTAYEKMYSNYRILSAISVDGINWTKETGVRINNDTSFDSHYAYAPDVIKLANGTYRMYYTGYNGYYYHILSAVSADGLVWKKEPGIRIEYKGVYLPQSITTGDVIALSDGSYRMYYSEPGASPYYPTGYKGGPHIVSATSPDGLIWTKEKGVRIDYGVYYDKLYAANPKIISMPNGIYRMFYTGFDGTKYYLLSAVSANGLKWRKEKGEIIAAGGQNESDSGLSTPLCIQVPNGAYRVYYSGYDGQIYRILSALSDSLIYR